MQNTLSPEEWAEREGMPRSTVYYLLTRATRRKLPHTVENIKRYRIPMNVTKKDIVKG